MSLKIIDKVEAFISSGLKDLEAFKNEVNTLLTEGANINEFNNYGTNPILRLAFKGNFDSVAYLISKGANLDVVDGWGYTALFASIIDNKVEQAKLIIDSGVNINYCDNRGNTYLDHCLIFGSSSQLNIGLYLFNKNAVSAKFSTLDIMSRLNKNVGPVTEPEPVPDIPNN